MKTSMKNILAISGLIISMLACGLPAKPLQLKSSPFSEESQTPIYAISAETPYLDPATDPGVQAMNAALKNLVEGEIAAFKGGMAEMPAEPISAGSSFHVFYELIGQKGDFWSIKFNIDGYSDGAAHPYHYSITFNYDLQNAKQLILDDIFLPNSNYLQVVSDYCKAELSARNIGFNDGFQQGADPRPENYKNWNISDAGLVITFDEGQVSAYAAGPQTVVIPFATLEQVVNKQSPLAPYFP